MLLKHLTHPSLLFNYSSTNVLYIDYLRFKIRRAQSDKTTIADANIQTSLITNRPAPVNNGNPCSPLPRSGTHASGVVTRKDKVPKVIKMTSPVPTKPTFGNHIPNSVNTPKVIIAMPRPCEKV